MPPPLPLSDWTWAWVPIVVFPVVGYCTSHATKLSNVWTKVIQPASTPPSWVFSVVWPLIYVLFGYSVSRTARTVVQSGVQWNSALFLILTVVSTATNAWWMVEFSQTKTGHDQHAKHSLFILLALSLSVSMQLHCSPDRLAGLCLVPYVVWSLFATLLNSQMIENATNVAVQI